MTEQLAVRPRRIRIVAWTAAAAVVIFFTLIATALGRGDVFHPGDQAAMVGLGIAFGAAILVFTRPLVRADEQGVQIRNVIGGYRLPWQVVRAVRFERGAAWATLELHDDDLVSVMAIQRADKQHAVAAVRALRAMHARYAPGAVPADAVIDAGPDTDS